MENIAYVSVQTSVYTQSGDSLLYDEEELNFLNVKRQTEK